MILTVISREGKGHGVRMNTVQNLHCRSWQVQLKYEDKSYGHNIWVMNKRIRLQIKVEPSVRATDFSFLIGLNLKCGKSYESSFGRRTYVCIWTGLGSNRDKCVLPPPPFFVALSVVVSSEKVQTAIVAFHAVFYIFSFLLLLSCPD